MKTKLFTIAEEILVKTINDVGSIGHLYKKRENLDPYLTHHTKINSKWIIQLKVKTNLINLPEEKMFLKL